MATRKTTDALEIIDAMYIRGNPEAEAALERARERLRVSMQLLELREKEGLTQQEMADRVGTSRSVIARIERGGYDKHTLSTLNKVAGAMGYAVKVEFVRLEGSPGPQGGGAIAGTTKKPATKQARAKAAV